MHRAVVFAHYDKYNSIQEYVLYYLKELRKVLFRMHLAKKEVCLLGRWYRW